MRPYVTSAAIRREGYLCLQCLLCVTMSSWIPVPTDLIEINPEQPSPEAIDRAAKVIRKGGVVAIPTDALYTLIADPMNLHAVVSVFKAKGRESVRSLPLLVSDLMMAEELAKEVTARFYMLARRYWPGPLTLIVPAN